MMRFILLVLLTLPTASFAQDSRETAESELEADMAAARARIKELKYRKKQVRLQYQAAQVLEPVQEVRKSSFFAEPRVGWSLLNQRSGASVGLSIGGVIRERVQLGVSLNAVYAPNGRGDWLGAGLAYGGLDTAVIIVRHRFIHLSFGGLLGGGAYLYTRDGGLEFGSVFTGVPHADLEVRPVRWLALGASGGYRFALGHPQASMNWKALSGPEVSAYIRFGL